MNTKEQLQAARALIVKGWCRNAYAKDVGNRVVDVQSPNAVKFCLSGACRRAASLDEEEGIMPLGLKLAMERALYPHFNWASYNDSKRNKRDVLKVLDKAIELAK